MSTSTPNQPSHDAGEPTRGVAASHSSPGDAVPADAAVARESAAPAEEWHDVCGLDEIPEDGIVTRLQGGQDLIVYRNGTQVTCVPNYCPHRGWPFDGGQVQNGILTCPFHGYEFRLDTGECLTSPSLPLDMYPIRIRNGRVDVRLK